MFPYSKKDQRATEPTWRELKKAEKKAAEYKLTSDNASIASSSISAEKEKAHSEYAKKLSSRFKVSSLLKSDEEARQRESKPKAPSVYKPDIGLRPARAY